jgi:hypothetical protein
MLARIQKFVLQYFHTKTTEELKIMSNYSEKMEAELRKIGSFNYDSAAAFADRYADLTTRSVVSKVKSMGLEYTPRVVAKASTARVRKSDIVAALAEQIGADADALAGLAKADMRSLNELVSRIS